MEYSKDIKKISALREDKEGKWDVINPKYVARMRAQNRFKNGIDIAKHPEENIWIPELIFGHLRTSTNYDKTEEKVTGGKNGYGAKLTNIYSTEFTVETVDSYQKKKYIQTWSNNMYEKTKPKICGYSINNR
jgi:DNA topoisomerase-2